MHWYFLLIIGLFAGGPALLQGQQTESDIQKKAEEFFYHGRYEETISLLKNNRRLRDGSEAQFLLALSYFHVNDLDEAEAMLSMQAGADRGVFPEVWLYLARIYHARHQFEQAAEHYKAYLKTGVKEARNRRLVLDAIRRCSNGLQLQFREPRAYVENFGGTINTEYDEFGAIQSPNYPDRLYFSSIRRGNIGGARNRYGMIDEQLGQYASDIYQTQRSGEQWQSPQQLTYLLNSPRHEVLLDIHNSGKVLYYFRGADLNSGQILVDTFQAQGVRSLTSDPLLAPVEAIAGNGSVFFAGDTMIIFPANRPGGYGGYDLYRTVRRGGRWMAPKNLGPDINTPYDETTPFLANNNYTLYYSSNHPELSLGGFDVLRATQDYRTGRWTLPENIGMPINSAGDETHFRLSKDGYTAYFTSSRKDGHGQRDLYQAYFFDFLPEMAGK